MSETGEHCGFLNSENRCEVHNFRPGICRLFPLGRYYEDRNFKYFLQIHECKNKSASKVKIKKWLGMAEMDKYETFINQWHYFLVDIETMLDQNNNENMRKQFSLFILQKLYIESYQGTMDFYSQFESRLKEIRLVGGLG